MPERERGFSLVELLIVLAIILIVASIAIPNFLRAKISANEASAVESLRSYTTAELTYSSTYGNFSSDLSSLGPANGAIPTSTLADLLDSVLAPAGGVTTATKSGYTFTYNFQTTSYPPYTITAAPNAVNETGVNYFYVDPSGVIHYNPGSPASVTSAVFGE